MEGQTLYSITFSFEFGKHAVLSGEVACAPAATADGENAAKRGDVEGGKLGGRGGEGK